jgi:hypothetical protein
MRTLTRARPRIETPFDDVQEIKGRRIRLPELLLLSPHHTPLDNAVYGLLDLLGGKNRGPVEAGVKWLAPRLAASVGGVATSLGRLTAPYEGPGALDLDTPAFVDSQQRGQKLTALRQVRRFVPFVEVPEWTLGDDRGPLVTHPAWRHYALLLYKRMPGRGTVAMRNTELAQLSRCRVDTLAALDRELEAAGMLITYRRSGRETVRLPLTVQLSEVERVRVLARLAEDCGQLPILCGEPVDNGQVCPQETAEPTPCAETAPTPSAETAPTASTKTSIKRAPGYSDPSYVVPVGERAAPSERAPRPKIWREVVAEAPPSAGSGSGPAEVPGRVTWADKVALGEVAVVDEDRKAKTRALIEASRPTAEADAA